MNKVISISKKDLTMIQQTVDYFIQGPEKDDFIEQFGDSAFNDRDELNYEACNPAERSHIFYKLSYLQDQINGVTHE